MALAHTKTELMAFKKADLVAALLDLEGKYAESERELGAFQYLHDFPPKPCPNSDPRRKAELFLLATAKYLARTYRDVDTSIPAVSRAVINDLREGVRQYNAALRECEARAEAHAQGGQQQ